MTANDTLVERWERGQVTAGGASTSYTLMRIDGRAEQGAALEGSLNVLLPGHGQTPAAVRRLARAIASVSPSRLVWCFDVDPPGGGDPVKARMLVEAIKQHARTEGWHDLPPMTLLGWSHGGGEALLSAGLEPGLFRQVVALCPTGLTERPVMGLIFGLAWEYSTAVWEAFWRFDGSLGGVATVALNALGGVMLDLLRGRSPMRLLEDIRWAARKVTGSDYAYDGVVVILLGERDDVIRWRDLFPNCSSLEGVEPCVTEYAQAELPRATKVYVRILPGDHMAPAVLPDEYARTVVELPAAQF